MDNGHKFSAAVIPEDLTGTVLLLGHNQSGHNGYQRTYAAIKSITIGREWGNMFWFIAKLVLPVQNKSFKKHSLKNKYSNQPYDQWSLYVLISLVNSILPHPKVTDTY